MAEMPNFFTGLRDGLQWGMQFRQQRRAQDQADRRLDQQDRRIDLAEDEFDLRREQREAERELADAVLGFDLPQAPIVGGGAGPNLEEDPERDMAYWRQAGSTSFVSGNKADLSVVADSPESTLVMMESSNDPAAKYTDAEGRSFLGLYQMGTPRLETLGVRIGGEWDIPGHPEVRSDSDYLSNPAAQKAVFDMHTADLEDRLAREGLLDHVGETVQGVPITRTGLLYAAHLGGIGGARALVKDGAARSDELGTSTLDYLRRGAMVETNMARARPPIDDVAPMQRALSAPARMVDASEWPSQFYGLDDMLHDGERDGSGAKMDMRLAYILDDTTVGMRTAGNDGFRLNLTSGTRSPDYNRSVGGARNSQHTHGRAVDLSTANLSTDEKRKLTTLLVANGARGIGTYRNGSIHVDVRDRPGKTYRDLAVWYGDKPYTEGPKWFQDGVRNGLALRRRRNRRGSDERMRVYEVASSAPAIPDPEGGQDVAVQTSGRPKGGLADRLASFMRGRGGGPSANETLVRRQLSRRGSLREGPFAEPAIPTDFDPSMIGSTDPVTGITTRRRPLPSRQALPMLDGANSAAIPEPEAAGAAIPEPEMAEAAEPAIEEPEAEGPAIEEPDERAREQDANKQRLERLRASMGGGYDAGVGLEVRQVGWDGQYMTKWQRRQLARVRRAAAKSGDLTLFSKFEKRLTDQINSRIYNHLNRAATFLESNPDRAVEEMKRASFYIDDNYIPVFDIATDPESGENALVIRNFNARTGAPEDPVVMTSQTITTLAENRYATEAIRDMIEQRLDLERKRQDLVQGRLDMAQTQQDIAFADEDQEMDVNNQIASEIESMATIRLPERDEPQTYGEEVAIVLGGGDDGGRSITLPPQVIDRIKTRAQDVYWATDARMSTHEAASQAMRDVFTAIGKFRDENPEEYSRLYAPFIHDMYLYKYDTEFDRRNYGPEVFANSAEGAIR